jgi:hypothetical protein
MSAGRSWKKVHWSDESRFFLIQLIAASSYGDREIQHFNRNILWTQLRLVEVRLLMRPLTIHRLRSVFIVLNGCCLASPLKSLSSLGVIFRELSVLWRSFTLPVWFTRCFNRTMTKWLALNYSAVCLVGHYICLIHKHIFFLGTCNLLSIDQLKNDETGFYKLTSTFAKLKFGRGF